MLSPYAHHTAVLHLLLWYKLDEARDHLQQGSGAAACMGVSSARQNTALPSAAERSVAVGSTYKQCTAWRRPRNRFATWPTLLLIWDPHDLCRPVIPICQTSWLLQLQLQQPSPFI
jgi:hypothetical protein